MRRHAILLLLMIPLALGGIPAAAKGRRPFRMGFTPFPPDITPEAVASVPEFFTENADVVAVHMEGVPWVEAGAGEPFHPNVMAEWERHADAVPPGAAVYLAVTPIHILRAGLAAYNGETNGMPIPEPYAGKAFDDPLVVDAYLAYCERAAEYFDPDWMAIGIEVDLLARYAPEKWDAWVRLHRHVYDALKTSHPGLPIFVTLTVHEMLREDPEPIFDAVADVMDRSDLVALSYYPFLGGPTRNVNRSLKRIREEFGPLGKPFAIAESGETAADVLPPIVPEEIRGSPKKQARTLKKLLRFARKSDFAFFIWYLHRDFDALWERVGDESPAWAAAWLHAGLVDAEGSSRPAHRVWKRCFRREPR